VASGEGESPLIHDTKRAHARPACHHTHPPRCVGVGLKVMAPVTRALLPVGEVVVEEKAVVVALVLDAHGLRQRSTCQCLQQQLGSGRVRLREALPTMSGGQERHAQVLPIG
jgi:hypothetical protein